ncbi:MAG: porin [Deltaproteobacteria bacterium]
MQKIGKRSWAKAIGMAFLAVGIQSAAHAVDVEDRVEIHGYGHQGYLQTTDNTYLNTDTNGTWDYNALALLFTAKIDDKSKIWMQLYGNSEKMRLDWVFIDYQLTGNLTGRAGQIKMPLGLYNEIRDIKFLQLSMLQPMLYQEAAEIAHEAYSGVSIVYNRDFGGGNLSWDAYLGQGVDFEASATLKNRSLVGGRVTYKTPVDGLRFMASAYNNKKENTALAEKGALKTWVLSADYTNNNWDIKAEYANMDNDLEGESSNTYYAQAGYTLGEKWTPFVRYDYLTTDVAERTDPSYYQKTTVLGLNCKINDSIAVRLENHWNNGYALPVASGEVIAGAGKTDWNMFAAGISYIF